MRRVDNKVAGDCSLKYVQQPRLFLLVKMSICLLTLQKVLCSLFGAKQNKQNGCPQNLKGLKTWGIFTQDMLVESRYSLGNFGYKLIVWNISLVQLHSSLRVQRYLINLQQ